MNMTFLEALGKAQLGIEDNTFFARNLDGENVGWAIILSPIDLLADDWVAYFREEGNE